MDKNYTRDNLPESLLDAQRSSITIKCMYGVNYKFTCHQVGTAGTRWLADGVERRAWVARAEACPCRRRARPPRRCPCRRLYTRIVRPGTRGPATQLVQRLALTTLIMPQERIQRSFSFFNDLKRTGISTTSLKLH